MTDINTSQQDVIMNNMTLAELRHWREQQADALAAQTKLSSLHNQQQKQIQKELDAGRRLSDAALNKLIKEASSKAGISTSELLAFTLGDTVRNNEIRKSLDVSTLNAFMRNIKKAAGKFAGGITPQGVINNSRFEDIKRANTQIHLATVYKRQKNVLYIMTNAGVGSKDTHHNVTVELINYPALITGRSRVLPVTAIKELLKKGKVRFDCDCGRHRYWYRYIATIGKYNFGIDETRYPSTRNPHGTGVACKHVLRAMKHLNSPSMVASLQAYMRADIERANNQIKSHRKSRSAIAKDVKGQAQALNNWNGRLHWSRQIKKALDIAAKEVKAEQVRQRRVTPLGKPTQAERSSYQYAIKQLTKKGVPERFKQIYQGEVADYQNKWGKDS